MGLAWERGWDWWGSFFSWRLGEGGDGVEGMVWESGICWEMTGLNTKTPYKDIFVHTKHLFYELLGGSG